MTARGPRLTVLGSAGTHPSATRVCAGYLLSMDGVNVLMDCGNGVSHRLQQVIGLRDLDAILISHLHQDHCADLIPLSYALRFHPDEGPAIPLYSPDGTRSMLRTLLPDESMDRLGGSLDLRTVESGQYLEIGPFTFALHRSYHPVETVAARITAGDRLLAYSGDSAPCDDLVACARDVDLFVCDATWVERQRPLPEGIHATAAEAADMAREAGAARLLLTHISPYVEAEESVAEAAARFDGEVTAAVDLQELQL